MSNRREFTRDQKEQIVERARRNGTVYCEGCGQALKLRCWEIDHIIPEALRPDADKKRKLTIVDGQLLGKCCHRGEEGKTNKDVATIAKAKRQYGKANLPSRPKQKIPTSNSLRTREPSDLNKGLPPLPRNQLYREVPHDAG